jgi:hypothetical protein
VRTKHGGDAPISNRRPSALIREARARQSDFNAKHARFRNSQEAVRRSEGRLAKLGIARGWFVVRWEGGWPLRKRAVYSPWLRARAGPSAAELWPAGC